MTIDSIFENQKDIIVHVPPKPEKGEQFIALIVKRGEKFRLINDDSCLIPVSEGRLKASDIEVSDYIQDMKAFINSEKAVFNGYKPSMYNVRHDISHTAQKIVTGSNDCLREIGGKYFRFTSSNRPSSSSITYRLNASGGVDPASPDSTITFEELKSIVAFACSVWNNISGIDFTISYDSQTEYNGTAISNDGISTITFEDLGSGDLTQSYYSDPE